MVNPTLQTVIGQFLNPEEYDIFQITSPGDDIVLWMDYLGNLHPTGVSPLQLEVNGTPNGNQNLLNLVDGTNVTIVDDGFGNITINASGGGGTPPGSPNLSLQGNDNGIFGGVPGSVVDFTNGLVTIAPPGDGVALTINSSPVTDPSGLSYALNITCTNAAIAAVNIVSGLATDGNMGVQAIVIGPGCVGFFGNASLTDDVGMGSTIEGGGGFATLLGTNVTGDSAFGLSFGATDQSTGGNAAEITGVFVLAQGNGTTPLGIGLHVGPIVQCLTNVGIEIDELASSGINYAIRTNGGQHSLGDIVSITSLAGVALTITGDNVNPDIDLQNSLQQSTVGAAGPASALPATPSGYLPVVIDGTTYVIPFYAAS